MRAPPRLTDSWGRGDDPERETLQGAQLNGLPPTLQETLAPRTSASLSDEQGNPFQQSLTIDGFTVSPVTGISQAVTVYLDGVRLNEPSVGQVNFDLVPLEDVQRIEWFRAPAVLSGPSSLGGSLHLFTARGGQRPQSEASFEFGTRADARLHGRVSGPLGPLDGYASVTLFEDPGWRQQGSGRGFYVFGKLGLQTETVDATLSYQLQRDRIQQPGSLPVSLLSVDRTANYTAGDVFTPLLQLLTIQTRTRAWDGVSLTALGFLRVLHAEQLNSNLVAPNTALTERSLVTGGRLQADGRIRSGIVRDRWTVGAELSGGWVDVDVQETPNSRFTEDAQGRPLPHTAAVLADTQLSAAAFVENTLGFVEGSVGLLELTVAARLDTLTHDIQDTTPDNSGAATAQQSFTGVSPAVTLSQSFASRWMLSLGYGQTFRAPAFLELTCANPEAPCIGLQAGLAPDASDTPLRPVVAKTLSGGLSGTPLDWLSFRFRVFRTDLQDDIFAFTPPGGVSVYFQNVARTRRVGFDVSVAARWPWIGLEANYGFVRATYEDDAVLATPRTADGTEQVRIGNLIPLTPVHKGNVVAWVKPLEWLVLRAQLSAVGPQYLRGDAANVTDPLRSYVLLEAGVEVRWRGWAASITGQNLLDRQYETFGTFAPDARQPGAPTVRFLTPGAPRHVLFRLGYETG